MTKVCYLDYETCLKDQHFIRLFWVMTRINVKLA